MIFTTISGKKGMNHFTQHCGDVYQRGSVMMQWLLMLTMFMTSDDVSHGCIINVTAFHQHVSPIVSICRNNNYDRQPGTSVTSKQQRHQHCSPLYMVGTDDTSTSINDDEMKHSRSIENHFFDSAIINHKLQGLNLSDQKLLVLQDAAKRVVQRHEAQMNEVQRQHSSTMATSIEEMNIQHQTAMEKLTRTMERRLQQMEFERKKLIDELKRTKQEYTKRLETQQNDHRMKLDELNTKYNEDRKNWVEVERRVRDELTLVERNAAFAAGEASLIIHQFNHDMERQRSRYQSLKAEYDSHQERYHRATTEIEQLRNEIQKLQAERTYMQKDVVRQQEQFREQMEIAESAVAAATNRENDWQVQHVIDALQQTNHQLEDQVSELKQKLQQQMVARREIEQNSIADRTRTNSPHLSRTLQRVYKYLWYNDQSLLRTSGRWIQSVFVPRIFPFLPTRRTKDKTRSPQK